MSERQVRLLLWVNAAVGFAFGVGLLVLHSVLLRLYGMDDRGSVAAAARFYGSELVGFNVATWLAATGSRATRRTVAIGHVANEPLTAVVAAGVLLAGLAGAMMWSLVAIAGAFAVAFALALPSLGEAG